MWTQSHKNAKSIPILKSTVVGDRLELTASGSWTLAYADVIDQLVRGVSLPDVNVRSATVDMANVQELDTLGAWLLERLVRSGRERGRDANLIRLPSRFQGLVDEVQQVNSRQLVRKVTPPKLLALADTVGRAVAKFKTDTVDFFEMTGVLSAAILRVLVRPKSFRFTSSIHHLYRVGWQAIPIIALITFNQQQHVASLIICANCGRELRLLGIEPEKPGRDLLTFECRSCMKFEVRGVSTE